MPFILEILAISLVSISRTRLLQSSLLSRSKFALVSVLVLVLACVFQRTVPSSHSPVPKLGGTAPPETVASTNEPYNLTVRPSFIIVYPGGFSTATVEVRSLGGFNGTVGLNPYPNYDLQEGFSASIDPYLVYVPPGGSANSTLTLTAGPSTPSGYYLVTMIGEAPPYVKENVTISVAGFAIDSGVQMSQLALGSSTALPISITSAFGFEGVVHFTVTTFNDGLQASLETSVLELQNGGTNTTYVDVTVPLSLYSFREGIYGVYVYGRSGNFSEELTLWITTPANSPSYIVPLIATFIVIGVTTALVMIGWRRSHMLAMSGNIR